MTSEPKGLWPAEPHTLAKLAILERYLKAWFPILYQFMSSNYPEGMLTYIDAGCGPGKYSGGENGSPILALKTAAAAKNPKCVKTSFYFIDHKPRAIHLLQEHVRELSLPFHFMPECIRGKIDQALPKLLDRLLLSYAIFSTLSPMFVFIDGWGNIAHMDVIWKILERRSTELFVFYNLMDTRRNIRQDHERERLVKVFGTEEVLKDCVQYESLYIRQLACKAKYVCGFAIKRADRDPGFRLFFATNNRMGFVKMKEAMWDVDQRGDLSFSDATSAEKPLLFSGSIGAVENLKHKLCEKFLGLDATGRGIKDYIEEKTIYLDKHKKQVLDDLLNQGLIDQPVGQDRRLVSRGTYPPGCTITFSRRFCGCKECRLRGSNGRSAPGTP
jgi:three-Cys-motif partner protein